MNAIHSLLNSNDLFCRLSFKFAHAPELFKVSMEFYGSPELSAKWDIFANVHETKLFLNQTSILQHMKSDLILDSIIQFSNSATMNLENCLRRSWNIIVSYGFRKWSVISGWVLRIFRIWSDRRKMSLKFEATRCLIKGDPRIVKFPETKVYYKAIRGKANYPWWGVLLIRRFELAKTF